MVQYIHQALHPVGDICREKLGGYSTHSHTRWRAFMSARIKASYIQKATLPPPLLLAKSFQASQGCMQLIVPPSNGDVIKTPSRPSFVGGLESSWLRLSLIHEDAGKHTTVVVFEPLKKPQQLYTLRIQVSLYRGGGGCCSHNNNSSCIISKTAATTST